ncbi:uncharacterized protein (TIGR03086 family) [Kribbella amoyensis]|uniref:Uncharacterized protein (TIGR03086 family) n=1 Tax=Kribbella amoyensis TaxID=996641 RepID=A0A561BKK9_9ACTN|nr:TIGR03086 family metal-binding protein [Kribbella amoyensis]TWD79410.1 uncharacterized protein (TIGR03086 family) [Kribbella amoyensis]
MDVVELHGRAAGEFVRLVGVVGSEQWDSATPCSDWDVRTLVNHVVNEERWTVPLMAGQTIEDVGDSLDGDLLGDDPATAAAEAERAAQASMGGPVARGDQVHLSYGNEDAAEYVWQLTADHLIHGWDLAKAIGAEPRLDPDVVDAVSGWFTEREELYREGGAIAERVSTADDPASRLLGAFGRDPSWTPAHVSG